MRNLLDVPNPSAAGDTNKFICWYMWLAAATMVRGSPQLKLGGAPWYVLFRQSCRKGYMSKVFHDACFKFFLYLTAF